MARQTIRHRRKALRYLRACTEEQTLGPDAQRSALEPWCSANNVELVDVFTDQGVSGGAALDKSPALVAAPKEQPIVRICP